ncbi:MAG: PCRF domain-containing protein, partial [Pseudomonadales bacterium]|nr:PCRF domain-containing protein [Pseudomonadales bacterium]
MKQSLVDKLAVIADRYEEVAALLGEAEVISDQKRFRDLSREYAEIEPIVQCYHKYRDMESALADAQALQQDDDEDMRAMAAEDASDCKAQLEQLAGELQTLLL